MNFARHKNCTGCGLCSLTSDSKIQMKWENGYLYPESTNEYSGKWKCALESTPSLHAPLESHIAYHKLLERRMDGSAGGVYGAILETIVKKQAYFTGTVYDEDLKVHHVLTNNPEQIKCFSGYKPTQSDPYEIFPKIKELLEEDKIVLFGGLPCQCHSLMVFLGKDYDNLYIVDTVCDGMRSQEMVDLYAAEFREKYNSDVNDIRFFNKEFPCVDSKRIRLKNGRILYTQKSETIDALSKEGVFTRKECGDCYFTSLSSRIGDITIGRYALGKPANDGFGYSYVSVNTEKGKDLYKRVEKRVVDVNEEEVSAERIANSHPKVKTIPYVIKQGKTLQSIHDDLHPQTILVKLRKKVRAIARLIWNLVKFSRLHPRSIYQFIKYNFCTKGVKTDLENLGFMFVTPHCEFLLEKNIHIEFHGPFILGLKRLPTSKLETRLRMRAGSRLIVHERGNIGNGSNVEIYRNATLEIGDLLSNAPIVIICGEHIKMGSPVNMARGCTIRDTNGHLVVMKGYKVTRPVEIGNHVWICSDSTVMPGVKIGDGSIVGACTFVTQNVAPSTLVQGNPAKEFGQPEYFVM